MLWVKRRRLGSEYIIDCANFFFSLAKSHVVVCKNLTHWQSNEINIFRLLHGDLFAVFSEGDRSVCAEELPGVSLVSLSVSQQLTKEALFAAGEELRRAHSQKTSYGLWSHGDPHLGNFIYDLANQRARLIDFETIHDLRLSADERHTDDLLVVLLDLLGRSDREELEMGALYFLKGYDRLEITKNLKNYLTAPQGIPGVWWTIRTSYIGAKERAYRIQQLRKILPVK